MSRKICQNCEKHYTILNVGLQISEIFSARYHNSLLPEAQISTMTAQMRRSHQIKIIVKRFIRFVLVLFQFVHFFVLIRFSISEFLISLSLLLHICVFMLAAILLLLLTLKYFLQKSLSNPAGFKQWLSIRPRCAPDDCQSLKLRFANSS